MATRVVEPAFTILYQINARKSRVGDWSRAPEAKHGVNHVKRVVVHIYH